MKINNSSQTFTVKSQVKVKKQEANLEPQEQVDIGSSQGEEVVDFLESHPGITSAGCATLGGGVAAVTSGTINGIIGAAQGAIGWGAQAIGGPIGGIVATVGLTGWTLVSKLSDPKPGDIFASFHDHYIGKDSETKKTMKALLAAGTTAAATALGANFGPLGIVYGGLARGGTYALVKGAKWGMIGASAGAATSTAAEQVENTDK